MIFYTVTSPESTLNQIMLFTKSYCFLICVPSDHFQNISKWLISLISGVVADICFFHLTSKAVDKWPRPPIFLIRSHLSILHMVPVGCSVGWICDLYWPRSSLIFDIWFLVVRTVRTQSCFSFSKEDTLWNEARHRLKQRVGEKEPWQHGWSPKIQPCLTCFQFFSQCSVITAWL